MRAYEIVKPTIYMRASLVMKPTPHMRASGQVKPPSIMRAKDKVKPILSMRATWEMEPAPAMRAETRGGTHDGYASQVLHETHVKDASRSRCAPPRSYASHSLFGTRFVHASHCHYEAHCENASRKESGAQACRASHVTDEAQEIHACWEGGEAATPSRPPSLLLFFIPPRRRHLYAVRGRQLLSMEQAESANRWKEMEKGNLTFGADSGGASGFQPQSVPQTPEGIFMENLGYKGGE